LGLGKNEVTAVEGFINDVTDLKEAQEKLENSEKYFRYLFHHNPLPMWIYDLQTYKFLDVNDAAVSKYGYSRTEFLSKTLYDIRPT
jgi:PAS domain-containing protein